MSPCWFETYRAIRRDHPNGIDRVIDAIGFLLKATRYNRSLPERERSFLVNTRNCMRHANVKARNLPTGSGVVEAANRVQATRPMKRSGMRWKIESDQAILTLRALTYSDRLERIWPFLVGNRSPAGNDIGPGQPSIGFNSGTNED